jgi:hypothetical protein
MAIRILPRARGCHGPFLDYLQDPPLIQCVGLVQLIERTNIILQLS